MHKLSLLPLALLTSLLACDDGTDGAAMDDTDGAMDTEGAAQSTGAAEATGAAESSGGAPTVDEDAIAQQAINFAMLEKINDEPVSSEHGLANTMNLWVDANAAPAYAELAEGTVFDPETIILKEQINGDGTLNSVAVMYKGPAGYSPDSGDWWFGLVNPDGSIRLGGQPGSCVGCHAGVSNMDWAWGLPGPE